MDQNIGIARKSLTVVLLIVMTICLNGTPSLIRAESGKEEMVKDFLKRELQSKEKQEKNKQVSKKDRPKYVEDELLVKFKEDKINIKQYKVSGVEAGKEISQKPEGKVIDKLVSKYKLEKKDQLLGRNMAVLKIKDGQDAKEKIEKLKGDPNVESVQLNYRYYPTVINPANDTDYSKQWGLHNTGQTISVSERDGYGKYITSNDTGTSDADIDAPSAWALNEGDNSVVVAVIDTGVAYNHPDLADNMWAGAMCVDENNEAILGGCPNHGWDYDPDDNAGTTQDNDPFPGYYLNSWGTTSYYYNSHGTHVAGIIAGADNASGMLGVAPHAQIMALKTAELTTDEIVKAIDFAENNGAKIINASWGGSSPDPTLAEAIENFDGLFVAAAGNDGSDVTDYSYPCAEDPENIICVAATDNDDDLAWFSDYSDTDVDVGAPGDNIISSVGEYYFDYDDFSGLTVPQLPAYLTASGGSNWQSKNLAGVNNGNAGGFSIDRGKVILGDDQNPYADNSDTALTSNTINLSDADAVQFYFAVGCDTPVSASEWTDYLSLEFSSDDGNSWNEIGKWDEYVTSMTNSGLDQHKEDGYYGVKYYYNDNIDSAYFTDQFKYRFKWTTDGANNSFGGCFVDEMDNLAYTKGTPGQMEFYSGTSMATPMVAGLAALAWSINDSLTKEEVKDIVLYTGDTLDSLEDKVMTEKRINAYRAVQKLADVTGPTVTRLGDGWSDYEIPAGSSSELVFNEAIATSSRSDIEDEIDEELSNSDFSGTVEYSWSPDGKTLTMDVGEGKASFNEDVNVTVSDVVGNASANLNLINSSSDETAPTGWVKIKNGDTQTRSLLAPLTLKATDNVKIYQMRFSNNGKNWSSWKNYAKSYSNWNMGTSAFGGNANQGVKRVYVQFKDRAGNISLKYSDLITYRK